MWEKACELLESVLGYQGYGKSSLKQGDLSASMGKSFRKIHTISSRKISSLQPEGDTLAASIGCVSVGSRVGRKLNVILISRLSTNPLFFTLNFIPDLHNIQHLQLNTSPMCCRVTYLNASLIQIMASSVHCTSSFHSTSFRILIFK